MTESSALQKLDRTRSNLGKVGGKRGSLVHQTQKEAGKSYSKDGELGTNHYGSSDQSLFSTGDFQSDLQTHIG